MVPACTDVNLRTGASTTAATARRGCSSGTLTVDRHGERHPPGAPTARARRPARPGTASATSTGRPSAPSTASRSLYAATGVLRAATSAPTSPSDAQPTPRRADVGRDHRSAATVTLFGRGWGHGVGLSQYGARGRALAGQDAATILAHYYSGTTIGSIPTETAIRVLLLDDRLATAASPLTVVGRGGTLDDRRRRGGLPGRTPASASSR